jgi:tRNA pseudouridine55 synthase
VRSGEDVQLEARPVTISLFEVLGVRHDGLFVDVDVEVTVSAGTYVRALARDLGEALGVGGHLTALRRTRIGEAEVADAADLDALASLVDAGQPVPLVSLTDAALAVLPALAVTADEVARLGFGKGLSVEGREDVGTPGHKDDPSCDVLALGPDGEAIAVLRRRPDRLAPVIVFAPAAAQ